ncbi:transcriptional regulator FeaR [Halomonas sediminis]
MRPLEKPSFDEWQASLCAVCGSFETHQDASRQFVGNVSKQDLDGLEIAHITTNVQRMIHRRSHSHNDDRFCFLVLQRAGTAIFKQFGEEVSLHSGHMVLMDSGSPFEINPQGLSGQVSLHLDREKVCSILPERVKKFGRLQLGSVSGRLLQLIVGQLLMDTQKPLYQAEGSSLQDSVIPLLRSALQGGHETPPVYHLEELYQLATHEIEKNLQSPKLDAETLAVLVCVSVRKLYRCFENQGESVHGYIVKRRIQRAAQDLIDPKLNVRSISAAAYEWGFCDPSHFSKAFKKVYGCSPKEYRANFHMLH